MRLVVDVMLGIPTIVTGAFVYAIWVINFGFSGYAGAFSLALVMVPLIVRATEEMLRLVPRDVREASLALGVSSRARSSRYCFLRRLQALSLVPCSPSRVRWVRRRRSS